MAMSAKLPRRRTLRCRRVASSPPRHSAQGTIMSVRKDPSGRRTVQVEVEVPGTPEEVWQAIATGPGVSSWFVPTEVREDGTVVSHFGPGMDAIAIQTAWEPPHRF